MQTDTTDALSAADIGNLERLFGGRLRALVCNHTAAALQGKADDPGVAVRFRERFPLGRQVGIVGHYGRESALQRRIVRDEERLLYRRKPDAKLLRVLRELHLHLLMNFVGRDDRTGFDLGFKEIPELLKKG